MATVAAAVAIPVHGLHEPPDRVVLEAAGLLRRTIAAHGLGPLELEFRMGSRDSRGRFLSSVPEAKFEAIVRFFETRAGPGWTQTQMQTRETCWGGSNGRAGAETTRIINDLLNPAAPPLYMAKRKVAATDTHGTPAARCSIALERLLPGPLQAPSSSTVRIKRRRSFSNGTWSLDLTRVAGADDDRCTYEVELELADKRLVFEKTAEAIVADALAIIGDLGRIAG